MSRLVTFVRPLAGFETLTKFEVSAVADAPGLFTLRSVEGADVRLYLLDAATHLPAYTPVLSDEQVSSLGLVSADGAAVFVIANPGETETTVNLAAPVVVNLAAGTAAQFILDGQDWALRAPLQPKGR